MSSLEERLKELMSECGLKTKQDLATLAGVSRGLVGQWFSGDTGLGKKPLLNIAKKTRFNPEWVADGTGSKYQSNVIESNAAMIGELEEWDDRTPLSHDDFEIPFFKQVELAAGVGREVVDDKDGFKLRFAKSTLKKANVTPCNARCVTVSGNSMEPMLPDGSTVGIDTGCTTIKDGKVYAIDHDGALRIKVLYKLPNGGLRLRSFNRDEWDDEDLSPEKAQLVRIIGRMFWSSVMW